MDTSVWPHAQPHMDAATKWTRGMLHKGKRGGGEGDRMACAFVWLWDTRRMES
jgi:hypothetical protein